MSSSQDRDQTESTGPESTVAGRPAPEATAPEATVPETTVPEDVGKPIEGAEEATVVVHEEPKEPGKSRSDGAGEKRFGGNPGKIILCHKNRVTISVGAPAEPAHLRHGDSLGAC